MRGGKSLFEKKNYFLGEVPLPFEVFMGNLISILTRVAGTDRGRNHQIILALYYLHKF